MRGGSLADLSLALVTGLDGTPMPSYVSLPPEDLWALAAHVRALAPAPGPAGPDPEERPGVAIDIPTPANAATLRGPDVSRSIDPAKNLALHPTLDAGVNSKLRLFYLSMGVDDGLITTHGAMKKLLQERGVKYTLVEVEGYGQEWKFWRLSLRDLIYICARILGVVTK